MAVSVEQFTKRVQDEHTRRYDTRRFGKPLDPSRVNGGLDYDEIRKRDLANGPAWRISNESQKSGEDWVLGAWREKGERKSEKLEEHRREVALFKYNPDTNNYE